MVFKARASNMTDSMEDITPGDCAWILSNAFLILTMQSGFGLLEAGFVSTKNMANIMVKNVVDVCLGGVTYWMVGYGLAFGEPSNWFCGMGNWFAYEDDERKMGTFYTRYVFQFSFATAATTIVSGAIAERMKLSAYILFSVLNVFVYVFPASWAWNSTGFLRLYGFHDFAGSCIVHLTGGSSALVMAKLMGPRIGRFERGGTERYKMSSPVTALTGTFMLWWAWLAFNCGSTFGIEGSMWKLAAKAGTNTLNGSIGGGIAGIAYSLIVTRGKTYDIGIIITGLLGGLVGVTAGCGTISPLNSLIVGAIASVLANLTTPLLEWLKIDDPVGAVCVHYVAASWGTLAVGVFGKNDFNLLGGRTGLIYGGYEQFVIQLCGMLIVMTWSMLSSVVIFFMISVTTGMRMSVDEELLGADLTEHNVKQSHFAVKLEEAFMSIAHKENVSDLDNLIQQLIMQVLEATNRNEHGQRVTMPDNHQPETFTIQHLYHRPLSGNSTKMHSIVDSTSNLNVDSPVPQPDTRTTGVTHGHMSHRSNGSGAVVVADWQHNDAQLLCDKNMSVPTTSNGLTNRVAPLALKADKLVDMQFPNIPSTNGIRLLTRSKSQSTKLDSMPPVYTVHNNGRINSDH